MLTQRQTKGFTLVEIMVAVSIFVVVAVIAVGALLTANRLSQRAQAIKLVMDNLNFALDSMALKMRRGYQYHCERDPFPSPPGRQDGKDCYLGGQAILFNDGEAKDFVYQGKDKRIQYWESGLPDFVEITRSDIAVENLTFYVFNSAPGTGGQPRVVINLYGRAVIGGQTTEFALENAVSAR